MFGSQLPSKTSLYFIHTEHKCEDSGEWEMKISRIFTIAVIVAALATVGFLFAQEEAPIILILPGSGGIGTAHTITLVDFTVNTEVDLTITRVDDDETHFQIQLVTDEEGRASTVVHSGPEDSPGEYRVSASTEGQDTVNATFQILSESEEAERVQPIPPYGDPVSIEDGAEINGETTAEKGIAAYTFAASAGDVLNAKLQSQSFDAYLVLLNEAGEELAMDDDGGDELNAHIENYLLPESGEFTLLATSWRYYQLGEAVSVGEYHLKFQLQRGDTTSEEPNPTDTDEDRAAPPATTEDEKAINSAAWEKSIEAELSETKPFRRYQFNIREGETLSLRLRSNDFDAFIVIEDANGEILAEDDDGDGGLNASLEELVFPAEGTYFAIISSWDHWNVENTVKSGTFTLEVWGDPIDWLGEVAGAETQSEEKSSDEQQPPADTQERENEEANTDATKEETNIEETAEEEDVDEPTTETHYRPIGYGDRLAAPLLADSEGLHFSLAAESGDRVDIVVASYSQLDTRIEVYTPAGELLAADDDSGRGYNPELLGLTLPETGTYTIIIRPLSQGDDQPVSIAIDQRAAAILAEAPLNIKLSGKQVSETVVLAVSEAGEIRLRLAIDGMQNSSLRIVATQGGKNLASLEIQGSREVEWLLDAREAGELQLLFSQHGADALHLQLERSHAPKTEAAAEE